MQVIQPLWDEMPLKIESKLRPAAAAEKPVNPFTDMFRSAIDAVKETDAEKTEMEYLMSTGQLDNPVQLILAENKAQLSVNLLVQLRTQAIEAYNRLTQINM